MSSDINGVVVAIQGNAIKPQSLGLSQDGYVGFWAMGRGNSDINMTLNSWLVLPY